MSHYIDLHIHSRFSRATSPALNPESLDKWGKIKGLGLIGTGDLTHPAWLEELNDRLQLMNDGFYALKENSQGTRFVPTGEVSCIYKQDGRTRKVHLVIVAPDLETSVKFSQVLGRLGNVTSDGRPILGLSARQILEIALNTNPEIMVIPAHIWTPWFSLFGAKSGFDHLEECFGDLSSHITALETGLSSDPAMNRLVSQLDAYALVSSSDAHSPDKLGREATILNGPLSRANLWEALKGGPTLGGTVEFFPEEGKYHLDGHLGCGPALSPEETKRLGGLCPTCGKPVTIGVLHRVMELADRESPREDRLPDQHLVPLAELLGQVFGQGPKTRRVTDNFERLVSEFGSELFILLEAAPEDIETAAGPLLRLAIERMRAGDIEAEGGFDGQYGTVTAIKPEEREELAGQGRLFETSPFKKAAKKTSAPAALSFPPPEEVDEPVPGADLSLVRGDLLLDGLDDSQVAAVISRGPVLAVVAGPGSGKTRVLVHRAAWLLREKLAAPEEMLLTTYTRKAAQELAPRLTAALPFRSSESDKVTITTLHGLAYGLMKKQKPDWDLAPEGVVEELIKKAAKKTGLRPQAFSSLLSRVKNSPALRPGETDLPPDAPESFGAAYRYYSKTMTANKWWDFDDLILEAAPDGPPPYKAVLVDEFQDLSATQFSFLKRIMPPGPAFPRPGFLTVIGDPDQSIYGFRGASAEIFEWLKIYSGLETVKLAANYRSTRGLVQTGESLMAAPSRVRRRSARAEAGPRVIRATLSTPKREAAYVVSRLMAHLGVMKLGREAGSRQDAEFMPGLALNEIAVLFRLRSLGLEVGKALDEAGLAWQISGEEPLTAADGLDFTADKINLLTMHAAKGLEFRLVFVIGAEEGLCPYSPPSEDLTPARREEEKRLFYVALTRAKDRLYLTRATGRRLYGQALAGDPSPFWTILPDGLCQDIQPVLSRPKSAKPSPGLFD